MIEQLNQALESFHSITFPALQLQANKHYKTKKSLLGKTSLQLLLPFPSELLQQEIEQHLEQSLGAGKLKKLHYDCQVHYEHEPRLPQVQHIILVSSGKGGVGKSTIAVNLAIALGQEGAKVGLLDADIFGPSIPLMTGTQGFLPQEAPNNQVEPGRKFGIEFNSIGFLMPAEKAAMLRGPMASKTLLQLLHATAWSDLDYLVIDLPPGTGDIQLTLAQGLKCSGSVIVTTPQQVALADAEKGITMFKTLNIPVLGIIENMSYFMCSNCDSNHAIFGENGGQHIAERHGVPLLAEIPLDLTVTPACDRGEPIVTIADHPAITHYQQLARQVSYILYQQSDTSPSVPIIEITED